MGEIESGHRDWSPSRNQEPESSKLQTAEGETDCRETVAIQRKRRKAAMDDDDDSGGGGGGGEG